MDSAVTELLAHLGPDIVTVDPVILDARRGDWLVKMPPQSRLRALIRPCRTDEVAQTLKICEAYRCPVTVQGGLTGLAGGAVPVDGGVALSLERMNAVEAIDPVGATLTVQAGITLQGAQDAADQAEMFFPLDLGARGSCTIGGNIGTNAGGNLVLRYGMMRALVLGLEVVLANGTVVSSMNTMLKNNAGFDLKQIWIGSEGTLGVVTRAVLRLFEKPAVTYTALCALPSYEAAGVLLRLARRGFGENLHAFEVMWPTFFDFASRVRSTNMFASRAALYLLIEVTGTDMSREHFEYVLGQGLESGLIKDAVLAQSLEDSQRMWALRDSSAELATNFQPHANFDVSVSTPKIGDFVQELERRIASRWAEVEIAIFGHVADSNIHMAIRIPSDSYPLAEVERLVYGTVKDFEGSISAEHGIGLQKKPYLDYSRSAAEIALMRQMKRMLDPHGILNPGKIFDPTEDAVLSGGQSTP